MEEVEIDIFDVEFREGFFECLSDSAVVAVSIDHRS